MIKKKLYCAEFSSAAWCPSHSKCALPAQDELATTKRSYEDQLSMMSDHLCSMNETLSKQREEIDTLKLGSKVKNGKRKTELT